MSDTTEKSMPELSRSLQPRHITMISIGGMIGAGLFVSSSAAIAATGPAIVVSYLITGTLVLLVMRMLGEMAMTLPKVRSFTEFARAGLGPWGGFVAGWLYWYFWMIVVPVEAIAGANILHNWLGLPPLLLGLILMGVMTAVNLMSARSYGEFEFWFASIKVAAILVFIALGAAFAFGFTSPTGSTFGNLTAYGGFMPKGLIAVLSGAVTVYFSLTGAEITTIAAAESKEPARAVARMSSTVIVRILTFYVGSVLLIVTVVPWIRVRSGESPFTLALTHHAVPVGECGHERHHPHRGALVPELRLLRVLAGAVRARRARRCTAVADPAERTAGADALGVDGQPCRSARHLRRYRALAEGVCVSRQCVRCVDGVHLHDDRGGAPARAPQRVRRAACRRRHSPCGSFPGPTTSRSGAWPRC